MALAAAVFLFVAWPIGLILGFVAACLSEKRCTSCGEKAAFVPIDSPRGKLLVAEYAKAASDTQAQSGPDMSTCKACGAPCEFSRARWLYVCHCGATHPKPG